MTTELLTRNKGDDMLAAFAGRQSDPGISTGAVVPMTQQEVFAPIVAMPVPVARDDAAVLRKLAVLAAAAGSEWFYRYPVKNKRTGTTDYIEGPSIKLANDLARTYGNCDVQTRAYDQGTHWLIYARFVDLETGFSLVRPFQQRKSQGSMGSDADRQLDIAFQIGVSKAIRNVVVNALQTFAEYAFEQARDSMVTKIGSQIESYRETVSRKLAEKIDIKRAEAVVGRSVADWLAPDIARLIALMKGVSDGMATMDETFPPLAAAEPEAKQGVEATDAKLDAMAAGKRSPSKAEAARAVGADPETGEIPATATSQGQGAEAAPKQVRRTEARASAPTAPPPAPVEREPGDDEDDDKIGDVTVPDGPAEEDDGVDEERAELIDVARSRGKRAGSKGAKRDVPAELKTDKERAEAWLEGYDEGASRKGSL